jgi:hypothetical protein
MNDIFSDYQRRPGINWQKTTCFIICPRRTGVNTYFVTYILGFLLTPRFANRLYTPVLSRYPGSPNIVLAKDKSNFAISHGSVHYISVKNKFSGGDEEEMIRMLKSTQDSAMKGRTQTINQMEALIITSTAEFRAQLALG